MKIIQINTFSNGSTGKIAKKYAIDLEQQGNESYFAYARGQKVSDVKYYIIGNKLSVYFHGLMTRITDRCGYFSKRSTQKLVKWMKKIKPDVVYLHNLHGYYINFKILFEYLKESNINIVWTFHDCWPFTGHCSYFGDAKCDKWITTCDNCPLKGSYPKSFISNAKNNFLMKKEVFTSIDSNKMEIRVPSDWLRNLVNKSFFSKYSVITVPNTIDESIFCKRDSMFRKNNNLEKKKIVLGVANLWDDRKGLDDFIALSKALSDEYAIVIVGVSKNQIKKNKKEKIHFIERTATQIELAEIYSSADVYFSPSRQETFGMTFLEAYKCGCKTIIGYNLTAIPEVLVKIGGKIINFDDDRIKNVQKIIENIQ